jgi:hypothetical protein
MPDGEEFDKTAEDGGDENSDRAPGFDEGGNEATRRRVAGDEEGPRPINVKEKGEFWQFMVLIRELLRTVDEPPRRTKHKHLPVADMLFIVITKVFFGLSSKDICAFLELLHPDLWSGHIPHRNSINNYLRNEWLKPVVEGLVGRSAQPTADYLGYYFSIDSTRVLFPGYYLSKDRKTGELYERRQWFRLHLLGENMTAS